MYVCLRAEETLQQQKPARRAKRSSSEDMRFERDKCAYVRYTCILLLCCMHVCCCVRAFTLAMTTYKITIKRINPKEEDATKNIFSIWPRRLLRMRLYGCVSAVLHRSHRTTFDGIEFLAVNIDAIYINMHAMYIQADARHNDRCAAAINWTYEFRQLNEYLFDLFGSALSLCSGINVEHTLPRM